MKRLFCLLLVFVVVMPVRAELIKWVDFNVPYESLQYALEQDIATLENNIGFFSKSKNAETLIADVREKIERTKRDMQQIIEKIKLIDQQEA